MKGMPLPHLRAPTGFALLVTVLSSSCGLNNPETPTGPTVSQPTAPLPGTTGSSSGGSTSGTTGSTGGTTGGSSALGAPAIVSPTSGSEVTESRPTLTVHNSTAPAGVAPVYSFQVASDSGFSQIVSQVQDVAEGSNRQTSWRVGAELDSRQYYWRARSQAGSTTSPYSNADFTVKASGSGTGQPAGLIVNDPLTSRSTAGIVNGGQFTSSGWRVTDMSDFIRYEVPSLSSGYVEWENRGLTAQNKASLGYMLFGMWDPSRGPYRENPYRVHLQKLDTQHNKPYIRLRWIANGEEHNVGHNFLDWNPQKTYHWRVEWGPSGGGNEVRVLLDGTAIITRRYDQSYRPKVHYVEFGIAERGESVIDAIYSNVRIGAK